MTAQISENLIFGSQKLSMCNEPLDFWLCTEGKHIALQANSSACWRGYIGTWKVIADRLYLIKFKGYSTDGVKLNLVDLFPGYPDKVFAHWFSEEVRCPFGKLLDYVHMGYASTYENDLYLTFKKGILISKRIVKNGIGEAGAHEGYGVGAFTLFNNDHTKL